MDSPSTKINLIICVSFVYSCCFFEQLIVVDTGQTMLVAVGWSWLLKLIYINLFYNYTN